MSSQQLLLGGSPADTKPYIDNVFSIDAWEAQGSAKTIVNGLKLSGDGGMVLVKNRSSANNSVLSDTAATSAGTYLVTNDDAAPVTAAGHIDAFTNSGYTIGTDAKVANASSSTNSGVGYSFKKTPGFFDIVTYTGNGSNRTIAHSLGCVPGMILFKNLSAADHWVVYHRGNEDDSGNSANYSLRLNTNESKANSSSYFQDTLPTASVFSIGTDSDINGNGENFVAYLFAGGASTASGNCSVDFDGSHDYIYKDHSDLHIGTNDYTVETWIWTEVGANEANIFTIDDFENGCELYLQSSGQIGLYSHNGWLFQGAADDIVPEQWTHVAVSRSSGTVKLFVNGRLIGSASQSSLSSGTFWIGVEVSPGGDKYADFQGKMSNFRVLNGTGLYTQEFEPPTAPLTNITNTKLLMFQSTSGTVTTATVAPSGGMSSNGTLSVSTMGPFDDLAAKVLGENADQQGIKTGHYRGDGSAGAREIYCGWEPQWVLIKRTNLSEGWCLFDSMRGIVEGGADPRLELNSNDSESGGNEFLFTTTRGFKLTSSNNIVNGNQNAYSWIAIRRPDGYIGKPAKAGTEVFAMDAGAGSSTLPNFDSGFPVDFAIFKERNGTANWNASARTLQKKVLILNDETEINTDNSNEYDHSLGWNSNNNADSDYNSWMWKRWQGFDMVNYTGNGTAGHVIKHNMNKAPEMMWIKGRTQTSPKSYNWMVYHTGLNGGTNPEQYYIYLNTNDEEGDATTFFQNAAPTSTYFTVGTAAYGNTNNEGYSAFLFASMAGISKVGHFTGNGSATERTITLGFQPRFIVMRNVTTNTHSWRVLDTTRGWSSGAQDNILQFDTTAQQTSANIGHPVSNGFALHTTDADYNENNSTIIYYAHA